MEKHDIDIGIELSNPRRGYEETKLLNCREHAERNYQGSAVY